MLDIKDTITSGQCFRFKQNGDVFTIHAGIGADVKTLTVAQGDVEKIKKDPFWSHFFDLETDYEAMKKQFCKVSPYMEEACEYAPGIRILNQDPWEALCSFVVSQNNNIKRIMGIIDRMCTRFGLTGENGVHGFPTAQALSVASEEELRLCGLGFRAPYIVNVSKAVLDGSIDFDVLENSDIETARKMLQKVKGIGPKVANCALLFGCHRLDCFPIDTWMKKIMDAYFGGSDGSIFGQYAGVAQQYLFHWARTGEALK